MYGKIAEISTLVSKQKPNIFGRAEANVKSCHDQADLVIPGYALHLTSSLNNPSLGNIARVAVHTQKSITVRRRQDLEDEGLQMICLEAGLPGKWKSIYIVSYRQWQLSGQTDTNSSTVQAQLERWDRLLTRWEAALQEGKEVVTTMDANLDALTWRKEQHEIPRHSSSHTHSALIDAYRPVNQLVGLSKIVERCVFGQLVKYLEDNSLLHPNQHGGRAGHSTTTTLIQMHQQWMEDLEDGKIVAVTLVDQSAAFDVCNHTIIESKLRLLGLESVEWVSSYLSGRTQSLAIGAALSAPLNLPKASVVQGGVGSGILYNVMTCGLPNVIHTDHTVSIKDMDHHCNEDGDMVTFVDDATSYYGHQDAAEVTRVINKNFKAIEDYMNANQLKVNSDKTHLLIIC